MKLDRTSAKLDPTKPAPEVFVAAETGKRKRTRVRMCRQGIASEAIGTIQKDTETFVMSWGQFSLIDAIAHCIDQAGPSDVVLSTWTAESTDLYRSAEMLSTMDITRLRIIMDRSYETRKPELHAYMMRLFGPDCIRGVATHAKFATIRSATHDIVIHTSMNLNENKRLENLSINECRPFAEFFDAITDRIFAEVKPGTSTNTLPVMQGVPEYPPFNEVAAAQIPRRSLNEVATTHTISRCPNGKLRIEPNKK